MVSVWTLSFDCFQPHPSSNNIDKCSLDVKSTTMSNPYDDPSGKALFEAMRDAGSQIPMPLAYPTPEEVRTRANKLSRSIFKNWNLLRHALERYESTIQKRWMKKTQDQRRKILLAAWPNMPQSHRPDIQAFVLGACYRERLHVGLCQSGHLGLLTGSNRGIAANEQCILPSNTP